MEPTTAPPSVTRSGKLEVASDLLMGLSEESLETNAACSDNIRWCLKEGRKAALKAGLSFEELSSPMRWSEDFGHYLKQIPGAFFGIGCGENACGLHTAGYEFNDRIIEPAIKIFQSLAADCFQ